MTAIRAICAWEAINTARKLGGVLGKAGFEVRLACGLAERGEIEKASLARECMLVIWSATGEGSHHVWEWVDAAGPETLVEVTIDGSAPTVEGRTEAPINLCDWNGDRSDLIHELERRIRRAGQAAPRLASQEPSRVAKLAFGALVAVGFVAAIGMRVNDTQSSAVASLDPTPSSPADSLVLQNIERAEPQLMLTPTGGLTLPLPAQNAVSDMRGEQALPEPESAPEGGSLSIGRRISARTIADPHGVTYLLPEPDLAADVNFRDTSLIGRLESIASPLIGRE